MGEVHIGTSGWHYQHWRGPYYPPDLPASRMLEFYVRDFDTVEINNTFYHLPPLAGVEEWRERTPPHFLFAAKGSRFLTHMKKLKDPEQGIARFLERVEILGPKLGPIVFQLPPRWGRNTERLEAFLQALPRYHRYAFEFREPSWHHPEVLELLHRYNAAFCIYELAGFHSPVEITADFTYVRLHGPGGPYQGSYERPKLKQWAEQIRKWRQKLKSVYLYFDNDQEAFAVKNALALRAMVAGEKSHG